MLKNNKLLRCNGLINFVATASLVGWAKQQNCIKNSPVGLHGKSTLIDFRGEAPGSKLLLWKAYSLYAIRKYSLFDSAVQLSNERSVLIVYSLLRAYTT